MSIDTKNSSVVAVHRGDFTNVGEIAIANGHEAYERHFSGLESIGKTGMTFLEEMIDGALRCCDIAAEQGIRKR
jgi:hypothetical protein